MKTKTEITAKQTITLNVKGSEIELSKDEATQLLDILQALLAEPKKDEIKRLERRIDSIRNREVIREVIERPVSIPQWPISPNPPNKWDVICHQSGLTALSLRS